MELRRWQWIVSPVVVLVSFMAVMLAIDSAVAHKALSMAVDGQLSSLPKIKCPGFPAFANCEDARAAALLVIWDCLAMGFLGQLIYSLLSGNSGYDINGLTKHKVDLIERQGVPRSMGVVVSHCLNRRTRWEQWYKLIVDWLPVVSPVIDVAFGLAGVLGTGIAGLLIIIVETFFVGFILHYEGRENAIQYTYGGVTRLTDHCILVSKSLKSPKLVTLALTRGNNYDRDKQLVEQRLAELGKTVVADGKWTGNTIQNIPLPNTEPPNYAWLSVAVINSRPWVLLSYCTAVIMQNLTKNNKAIVKLKWFGVALSSSGLMANEIELFVTLIAALAGFQPWSIPRGAFNFALTYAAWELARNPAVHCFAWVGIVLSALVSSYSMKSFSWFGVRAPESANAVEFLADLNVQDVGTCVGFKDTRCTDNNPNHTALKYIYGWCENAEGEATELCHVDLPVGTTSHNNHKLCGAASLGK